MIIHSRSELLQHFHLLGTNFTRADTQTRSRFAITKSQAEDIYRAAAEKGFEDFLILSTCNRTELYAVGHAADLQNCVVHQLRLNQHDVETYFYKKSGKDAVEHFFRVVAGLDSQIIGDYEIMCQVKTALEEARKYNLVGTITDRVANFAFQASKKVKTHTNISNGKYSVSFAAAELIAHENEKYPIEKILLVGTGSFGTTVALHLRRYFPAVKFTLCNRTGDKADALANRIKADILPFDHFQNFIDEFDAIVTTVGLQHYLVDKAHIRQLRPKLFVDLSVPQAINPELKSIPGVRLFTVDEVSAFHNNLLKQRKLDIPRAEKILSQFIDRFMEWYKVYRHRHIILGYQIKIQNLTYDQISPKHVLDLNFHEREIEKNFSKFIRHIKVKGYTGCNVIEAMTNLITSEK
jgi:glutamyl-tRNA reductase